VTDLDTWPSWLSGLIEVKSVSEGPLKVGSTFTIVTVVMGRESDVIYTVTEFEQDKKVVDISPGNFTIENLITFGRFQDGTEIHRVTELTTSGLYKIFLPIVSRTIRKQVESSYSTLKELLETDSN
jgi:hypothetical protein